MKKLPGALFVVDLRKEKNAIAEARKLGIPIVAIVDTTPRAPRKRASKTAEEIAAE